MRLFSLEKTPKAFSKLRQESSFFQQKKLSFHSQHDKSLQSCSLKKKAILRHVSSDTGITDMCHNFERNQPALPA